MTRDEAIRLVKESGLHVSQEDGVDEVLCCDGYHLQTEEVLKLVQLACASEREACAKTCEARSLRGDDMGAILARAIRARSRDGN